MAATGRGSKTASSRGGSASSSQHSFGTERAGRRRGYPPLSFLSQTVLADQGNARGFPRSRSPFLSAATWSFQESREAGLIEVMIRCQGVDDPATRHDCEARAINETPWLVLPSPQKVQGVGVEGRVDVDDFDPGGRSDGVDDRQPTGVREPDAVDQNGDKFREDVVCRHDNGAPGSPVFDQLIGVGILGLSPHEEGGPTRGVGESLSHRGRPRFRRSVRRRDRKGLRRPH
jgi:hypothetical protein